MIDHMFITDRLILWYMQIFVVLTVYNRTESRQELFEVSKDCRNLTNTRLLTWTKF